MKTILSILFTLTISLSFAQVTGVKVINAPALIIIAGESNATATGLNDSLSLLETGIRNKIKYFDTTSLTFSLLNVPNTAGIKHGFEVGLANCADSGTLGSRQFYVVKTGVSGTVIRAWYDTTISPAWTNFKIRVDSAIKLITANEGVAPATYLFWTQGINDATALNSPTQWKDSTKSFFRAVRSRYGRMPILMTEIPAEWASFNDQIILLPNEVSQLYLIPARDAILVPADNKHWSPFGLKQIAARMVQILVSKFRF